MAIDTSPIIGGGVIDYIKDSNGSYIFPITKIESIYDTNGNTLQSILDNKQPKGDYSLNNHNHDSIYALKSHTHEYLDKKFTTVTVNGNADTYYPVTFELFKNYYTGYTFKLGRGYSATAPNTWNTSTHRGGLTLQLNISGDNGWGGNSQKIIIEHFDETYCNMVAKVTLLQYNYLCIWLRGGGALYYATTEYGAPSYEVHYSAFNDADGKTSIAPIGKSSVNSGWQKRLYYTHYYTPELAIAANKLNTARTISIGGATNNFDGSGNISWGAKLTGVQSSAPSTSYLWAY